MRQLNFIEPHKLEWRDVPEPALEGDGEAVVRPVAVATCDLDTAVIGGKLPVQGPFALGHECVAEVTEVGDGVSTVQPGELVSVPFQISCGECDNCRAGHTGNCTAVARMSAYGLGPLSGEDFGGFLQDTARVPFADAMLVPLGDGVDPVAVASLSDNIPDAWRTVGPQLAKRPGAPVLVVGGWSISIPVYAVELALALGAERVDFVGGREREREKVAAIGANLLDQEFPERAGRYPITVDASGQHEGLACALRSTDAEGFCTSIGIYFEPTTPVPLLEMYTKGITFRTSRVHARPAMPEILELVREGRFHPENATGQVVDFDDAAEALADHDVKTVLKR
jgi:threonine dehydrogenase-like Zn-dependent dehydrogenase